MKYLGSLKTMGVITYFFVKLVTIPTFWILDDRVIICPEISGLIK